MSDAILSAVETATMLKVELQASGDEVRPTWFEAGSLYNGKRMKLSRMNTIQHETIPRVIDMTLLPGLDIRHSGSQWTVLTPAVVHVSS